MIVGMGLDIVETRGGRWARALESIEEQIFTPLELASCADRVDRIDALAARFAAKEACLKALNAGIRQGALRHIEIVSDPATAPTIRLTGALALRARASGVRVAHVSLTHHEGLAAAVVILEGTRKRAAAASRQRRSAESWTLEMVSSSPW
jgi:holo-[acyl-carrier protein] synthase